MNLHARLREREAQGKPLRVGLIGAGKFAAMYLAQVPRTPGIRISGIADLQPANARANLARVGWPAALVDGTPITEDWRKQHPDLKDLPFTMVADTKRELSQALGVLHPEEGVALRATFIVDPNGVIRHVGVNDLSVGRSVDEVMRILDALQTDELCPCNWVKGQPTLEV